jgi:protein involved in polysaccharide export with SLBB domain
MIREHAMLGRRMALLQAASLGLAGCGSQYSGSAFFATTANVTPVEALPQGFAAWTEQRGPYRFGAGDKLRVQFLLTPELGDTVLVAPDGAISLRAAGRVMAEGRTVEELQEAIAAGARRTLTQPIVTVSIEEPGSAVAYVGGMVKRAGAYPVAGRRGVLEQVVLAGGFEPDARVDEVVLIRRNPENRPMLRRVNVQEMLSSGGTAGDLPLLAGDIIFVPRNRISEVTLWIDQFIKKVIPVTTGFNYALYSPVGL